MLVKEQDKKSLDNYSQIVEWPAGERQGRHDTFCTTYLYLYLVASTDDYEGGDTIVVKK